MIWLILASAFAGIPTYEVATAECELQSHSVELSCKKGVCVVEERLRYYKPDCVGEVSFPEQEPVEPILNWANEWVLPAPCSGERVCFSGVGNRAVVRRVLGMGESGSEHGLSFAASDASMDVRGGGLTVSDQDGWRAVASGGLKKSPKWVALKEAATARTPTSSYGGPTEKGLRHGVWLASHPDGHPMVREIRYARGVRVESTPWQARTLTEVDGRVLHVDELDRCPSGATIDTTLGDRLTQSCAWSDVDGAHAIVATFQPEPWQLLSVETVLNGKRSGEALLYEGGALVSRQQYAADRVVGEGELWWPNGQLRERSLYAADGSIGAQETYDEIGRLRSKRVSDIRGLGGNPYEVRFDARGHKVEERLPLDAARSEHRVWTDGVLQLTEASRDWTTPATGCAADIDCPADPKKKGTVGVCEVGQCLSLPDPANATKQASYVPLRNGAPLEAALREAIGGARRAWINPNLIQSRSRGCVEVSLQSGSWLPEGPRLTGRAEVVEQSRDGEKVRSWVRLDLDAGGILVEPLSAAVTELGLEPRPSRPGRAWPMVLSKVDAKAATYALDRFELEASCTPVRTFARCKDRELNGWAECEGQQLQMGELSSEPTRNLTHRRPGVVLACEAPCPAQTCEAEAPRLQWLLEHQAFQRPARQTFALWWAQEDCESSLAR
ncbi:MAG: hypothetical protein KC912_24520 [Proteobacteria bacterium]|nr:hypothetical protein [Pseudomonadota bacterium]